MSALADAPTLWALQRALAQVEHRRPGALFGALRPVIADQSSAAGQLAKALRIRSDGAPAVQISEWLLDVLTAHPAEVDTTLGGAGSVFAQLRAAGVVVPRKVPPETALVRIAVAAAAGLDTQVGDWRRWLASACRRPATDWSQTRTLQRLRVVLNAAWREELASDDPPPAPAPAGDDVDVGQHDAAPPLCAADVGGPTSEQIAELLPAALAVPSWYSTLGYDKVANSPHLARAAVAAYLAAQSTG